MKIAEQRKRPSRWRRYSCFSPILPLSLLSHFVASQSIAGVIQSRIDSTPRGGTVQIEPGHYVENLVINKEITLIGGGADSTIIDGSQSGPVISINAPGPVSISGVTITGGSDANSNPASQGGAGIRNAGSVLTLTECIISNNVARAWGGGIWSSGQLILKRCTLIHNQATTGGGGGILVQAGRGSKVLIDDSTVSQNIGESGGGMRVSLGAWLTLTNSRVSFNEAQGLGAGVCNEGETEAYRCQIIGNSVRNAEGLAGAGGGFCNSRGLRVIECTIAGNSAREGGGIYSISSLVVERSTLTANTAHTGGGAYTERNATFSSCTLSGNEALQRGGGLANRFAFPMLLCSTIHSNRSSGFGGGVYNFSGPLTEIHLGGTIVAGNSATSADQGPDCHGKIESRGYNLIQATNGAIFSGEMIGNLLEVDPTLGVLQDNGGPTWTHALLSGSPAIDSGAVTNTIPTDQRGIPRPQDGDGDGLARSDIGAFEKGVMVRGRYVFYNRSQFDGNSPEADTRDDGAIAIDKVALLPGGSASFANYTSFSRGINGILIDIEGMPGTPGASDFIFRVGNDDNPDGWSAAPVPRAITVAAANPVRPAAGTTGIARVTILWPDNAIQGQWLQVVVLSTAATGLGAPDVFYFGNAIGDCGNSSTDARVNATDEILARNNARALNQARIDSRYDYNRDSRVSATDQIIARNNRTSSLTALRLITVPP
jgi:hypothetical protein